MNYLTQENYFCHDKNEVFAGSIPQDSTVSKQSPPTLYQEALKLIARGFAILPLNYPVGSDQCSCGKADCTSIGKHPLTKNGVKDAPSDRAVIDHWWKLYPQANIGIATGGRFGLCVIDVDRKHGGFESLAELEAKYEPLPLSLRVKTGGDGLHIFLRSVENPVKNRVNLFKGIDVRGDGGYVVAPPSHHASGDRYEWINSGDIEPLPEWLRVFFNNFPRETLVVPLGSFLEGHRNQQLASIAGYLRAKGLEVGQLQVVLKTLNEATCSPALSEQEVKNIALSISKYPSEQWPKALPLPKNSFIVEPLRLELIPSSAGLDG